MAEPQFFKMSELISSLSLALDLAAGQPLEHSARTCYIGMRLAERLGLSREDRTGVYYGALLKDVG